MQRRKFLRHLLSTPVAAATFLYGSPFLTGMRIAHAAANKTLIVVFQRGGCDGLNTVIPYGDDHYYNHRPNLAIAAPNSANSASAININDNFFGLHPALKTFENIYKNGDLAILPAVRHNNAPFSHFRSQQLIEAGVLTGVYDGWLNRYLLNTNPAGVIPAGNFGASLSDSLKGSYPVSNFSDFSSLTKLSSDSVNQLRAAIDQDVNDNDYNRNLLHIQSRKMLQDMDILSAINLANYQPANGASYPSSSLGKQLLQVAQLIKSNVGLELAAVDSGGWDTHANQGGASGTQATRLADFSNSINALYSDLGTALMQDVVILTITEFGRTVKENASGGTDHGFAANWFAIGGSVLGGIYGNWPGLAPENLLSGRYLKHNINYSDVLSEVISRHLGGGANLNQILPGHTYSPIGFL